MGDPNVVGHIELTCGICGFRGTPIVVAAHDCRLDKVRKDETLDDDDD